MDISDKKFIKISKDQFKVLDSHMRVVDLMEDLKKEYIKKSVKDIEIKSREWLLGFMTAYRVNYPNGIVAKGFRRRSRESLWKLYLKLMEKKCIS